MAETRLRGLSRRDQWDRRSHNAIGSPAWQCRYHPPAVYPLRAEKQGKSPKVQGKAYCTRCKGKGVVNVALNAVTAASALSSTQEQLQDNVVRVVDAMQASSRRELKWRPLD